MKESPDLINIKKGKCIYVSKLQCEYLDFILEKEYKNCTDSIYLEMIQKLRKKFNVK